MNTLPNVKTDRAQLAALSQEMLEAWQARAWSDDSDRNYASFLTWLAEQLMS